MNGGFFSSNGQTDPTKGNGILANTNRDVKIQSDVLHLQGITRGMVVRNYLIWVILLFPVYLVNAQSAELRFESYTTENGLTQNSGYSISQTRDGFMWFGTQDGLNRFDGYRFKIYKKDSSDSLSVCGNQINDLCLDQEGNLWVATPEGVCVYIPEKDKFMLPSRFLNCATTLDHVNAVDILQDKEKNIWVLSALDVLYVYNQKDKMIRSYFAQLEGKINLNQLGLDESGNVYVNSKNELYTLSHDSFVSIGIEHFASEHHLNLELKNFLFANNELWISTQNSGLFRLNYLDGIKLIEHIHSNSPGWNLSPNETRDLLKDKQNNIWIGTSNDGLYRYSPSNGSIKNGRFDPRDKYSLKRNYVINLFEDKQGIIWVGTSGGGIAKYDPAKFIFNNLKLTDEKGMDAPDNMIMSLFIDRDKTFYAGTQSGGLIESTADFSKVHFFSHSNTDPTSILHDNVYQMTNANDEYVWIATCGGLCHFDSKKNKFTSFPDNANLKSQNFYSIAFLKDQNKLIASGPSGLSCFDISKKSWQNCNDVKQFLERNKLNGRFMQVDTKPDSNIVWIASEGLGLIKYNYKAGLFKVYPKLLETFKTIRHFVKVDNEFWLATDHGLVWFDEPTGNIKEVFSANSGLPGEVVYAILPDKQGRLWVSTNFGISCFNIKTASFKNFDYTFGIEGSEFNTAACCVDQNGRFYFGGISGILCFDPDSIIVNNYTVSPLITGIRVMESEYHTEKNSAYTDAISLCYNQNFINLDFSSPNFSHTLHNKYQYMLEGINETWVDAGSRNSVSYTNLPPGNHLFKVKAANSEGIWSEKICKLMIKITPPFWKTWWFIIVIILFLAFISYFFYKRNIRNLTRRAELDNKLKEYEMKALHSQMNPHFIFNCLNSIKEMILHNENEHASKYLSRFAQLIRDTLDQSKQNFISLRNSIDYLKRYIEMEKLRFDDFEYKIIVEDELEIDEIKIPPMLLQPLVENAIWHGLRPVKYEKKLEIGFSLEQNMLKCTIDDNGLGFNQNRNATDKGHTSLGIENICKRIELLNEKYHLNCSLEIINKTAIPGSTENGTRVSLYLPLETE